MKKCPMFISYIFIFLMLIVGCSTKKDRNSNDQEHITIVTYSNHFHEHNPAIARYIQKFEIEKGIKVKVEVINANNCEDYVEKLNIKLYMKEGPTLIFFMDVENYSKYVDAGVALNVKGKIQNYDKVYDSLKYNDCYVPISMTYNATILNDSVLDELEVKKPDINWTVEEYLKIKEKWLAQQGPTPFNITEYRDIVESPLYVLEIIDKEKKIVDINNNEIKALINNARERIFSGDYIIDPQYTYTDYYNMFLNYRSSEHFKSFESDYANRDKVLKQRFGVQALKTFVTSFKMKEGKEIILTRLKEDAVLTTSGFIINRNGKNIELAMELLNGLLSDQVQLSMFDGLTYGGYPVNRDIEDKISEIERDKDINEEAIALRKHIIEKIKDGECNPYNQIDSMILDFRLMLQKDLLKLIFSDKTYSDEELSLELKRLEDKYNMWINE